jgi:hypothetical protein
MAYYVLDSVPKLRRALYRLLNTAADDPALIENDSDTLEAVNLYLQQGIWDAQEYLISCGAEPDRWLTTSSAITWAGSESTGGYYVALASDFLRLDGDENNSALHQADDVAWGRLIDARFRRAARGNYYCLRNKKLYRAKGSNPPSPIYYDYHHRHALLVDSGGSFATIDFPIEDAGLIVAFAGQAAYADFFVAGDAIRDRVREALHIRKQTAARRSRRTKQPRQLRSARTIGTHFMR